MVTIGYLAGQDSEARTLKGAALGALQEELASQAEELAALQQQSESRLQGMTMTLAEFQARMTRLDALGEHLTAMANLEDGEFDFSQPPAMGGPLAGEFSVDYRNLDIGGEMSVFQQRLTDREQQLDILESLLTNRNLNDQVWISGRPVEKGWISSDFGQRTDPFTGKPAMHDGIDFAGKEGSNVVAVAGGVVTWTGTQSGYGEMVEISHGEGFVTRYAHNKQNLVEPGDVVRKGEPIGIMGSSGRSTGAHVHFEVYKHGRAIDPASYVSRTRR
jgi:murein DD-endopeptidase MepM/ murein hydrolase activator NlpD